MKNDKQKDRLVELLDEIASKADDNACRDCEEDCVRCAYENVADYLLANGVIVPPCKVGDKLYIVAEVSGKIIECTVIGAWICEGNCNVITDCGTIYNLSYGETVFLSRKEAEEALGGVQ